MTDKKRVLLVGSANMDLSANVYKVPSAGETVTGYFAIPHQKFMRNLKKSIQEDD